MDTLRDTMLAEEEKIAAKQRFGLFSQPPPLSMGDDSFYRPKEISKGQDGKPKTEPRGIYSGLNRTGMRKRDYICMPQSIYTNDPYADQQKQQLVYYNKLHSKSQMHECDFKPASRTKTLASSSFQYVEEKQSKQKLSKRDSGGRVVTEPPNVCTNPTPTVEHRYMKCPTHMSDPYERKDFLRREQQKVFKSKLQEVAFKSMEHGGKTFTKDKVQFGIDEKTKEIINKIKQRHKINATIMHQQPFKPSGLSGNKTIGKYPQYIAGKCKTEASINTKERDNQKKVLKEKSLRQSFKPGGKVVSKPCPSISLLAKNWHYHAILRRN